MTRKKNDTVGVVLWLLLIAGIIVFILCAKAATTTLVGSMSVVNNTSSNIVQSVAGSLRLPSGYFLFQNGGTSNTNALNILVQFSTDGTNFLTAATYVPTTTNAMTEKYTPSFSTQTIYFRALAVTTNNVSVGGAFVQ